MHKPLKAFVQDVTNRLPTENRKKIRRFIACQDKEYNMSLMVYIKCSPDLAQSALKFAFGMREAREVFKAEYEYKKKMDIQSDVGRTPCAQGEANFRCKISLKQQPSEMFSGAAHKGKGHHTGRPL